MVFLKKVVSSVFDKFARNMMCFHFFAGVVFLIVWQLEKRNIVKKIRANELVFGIFAVLYGIICIYFYIYSRKIKN